MRCRPRGRQRSVGRGAGGPGIEPRKDTPGCRRRWRRRKAKPRLPISRGRSGSRAVRDPEHVWKHLAWEPGGPVSARRGWRVGTHREVQGRTAMMNGHGKSDRSVVPRKSPNNTGQLAAEEMEGRDLAKGNPRQQNALRTPSRDGAPSALERIRQAARQDRTG